MTGAGSMSGHTSCMRMCVSVLQYIRDSSSNEGESPQQLPMAHLDGLARCRQRMCCTCFMRHLMSDERRWRSEKHARRGASGLCGVSPPWRAPLHHPPPLCMRAGTRRPLPPRRMPLTPPLTLPRRRHDRRRMRRRGRRESADAPAKMGPRSGNHAHAGDRAGRGRACHLSSISCAMV